MKYAPVLVIVAAGALVGWLAPDLSKTPGWGRTEMRTLTPPAELAALRADVSTSGADLVLDRAGDGHFYADVTVDAFTSRMLVDTGATVVALTGADAEAMGITWEPEQVRPVARGASGAVYGVLVTIEQMQVGDFEASGVQAVVVPEGLGISLLGQSFLSQVPSVQIDQHTMTLGG